MRPVIYSLLLVALVVSGLVHEARAQQVQSGARYVGAREGFYEHTGVSWSFRGPGFFTRFGGLGQGRPAFGGFRPSAGLSAGWSVRRGPFTGSFGFSAVQGVHRSHVSSSTVLNGLSGYPARLTDVVVVPYVSGMVPVGGFYSVAPRVPYRSPSRIDLWRAARRRGRPRSVRQEPAAAVQPESRPGQPLNLAGEAFRQLGGK